MEFSGLFLFCAPFSSAGPVLAAEQPQGPRGTVGPASALRLGEYRVQWSSGHISHPCYTPPPGTGLALLWCI